MKLACIIITYNPSEELLANIAGLDSSVDRFYVVDNDSRKSRDLLDKVKGLKKVCFIQNPVNLGIATALNQGVQQALKDGAQWILTLDQDTELLEDSLQAMFSAYDAHPNKENIGIIAPIHFDRATGYQSRFVKGLQGPYAPRKIVMSSGNLIPCATYKKVGFYDDDLFIEYVDHDFCLRATQQGLEIIVVKEAKMAHSLGTIRQHRFGPLFFFSHNYLPVRRYYRARNRLVLYRRHFGWWILQDQEFAIKDMVKILLVENQRWEKVKSTILGSFDGLLARMGDFTGATNTTPKAQKYFVELREEILPLLPDGQIGKVMDLGCGSGETSAYLKKSGRFSWVCGVEGSPEAAAVARQKLDQVVEGDIEKIEFPFAEGSFDLILALDILEHLMDPWVTIAKLKKLLKPGGQLIVSIPNVRHYSVVIPLLFMGDWRYTQEGLLDSTHIRFFTRSTVRKLFLAQDFTIEKMDHTGAKKGLGAILNRLTLGIFKEFFIFQNLLALRK